MPRNRSLPPHLEIRRNGFYWRRRLPRSLRDRGGASSGAAGNDFRTPLEKSFLCFSLRTHLPADAKILARRLTEMSDLVFAAGAEMTMAIAPETQVWMLESLVRFEIEAFERARAVAGPRSPEAAAMDLRREEALQATLRQALWLGDREVARQPLRHVAARLGLELDAADEDWTALAYEATRVLLDVSQERARRQQGIYDQPTVFFRRAIGTATAAAVAHPGIAPALAVAPAAFASTQTAPTPVEAAPASFFSETMAPAKHVPPGIAPAPAPDPQPTKTAAHSSLLATTALTPAIVPAGLDMPDDYDEQSWQKARIATRPPRILIDRTLLSEASRAALDKHRGITFGEAIELHYELLSWGYHAPFNVHQKRKPLPRDKQGATLEERLTEDHRGKRRFALDFWLSVIGDIPVDEIHVDDVNDGLEQLWQVPNNHGRSEAERGKFNMLELIERADAQEAEGERKIAAAKARGATEEEIDQIRLDTHVARLSVSTYIKHGRVARAIGEMLWDMQLIDQNPFSICTWTNKEVKALKSGEGGRKRVAWDDRIYTLFGSRVFQEPLEDIGEPLFWAPLIARHQGLRMEECLQLGPDDFGSDKGIPYLKVSKTIINGVKTLSSERIMPLHPQLIELGLLKLVEFRRKEKHIRLFPFLTRGVQKGTFSANFSKSFGYYRRTNDCYWPGLDFHALRTTFHNDLLTDDKSDAIRCRLMGHANTDEGDRSYGQSLGIEALAERMKSVVVDISMIRSPFDAPSAVLEARAKERGLRVVA
ncbi:hypothetical protein SAMN05444340_10514 [Citreimonas salinaria]|uniref:Phage integrase family protein n=2 Tax=Citreimonas salinaria TaxID=321339 RepID=A0A1H3IEM3_9RHOB|nr:hypothetical protein SAMN05444340_10514 [Citreimonas salinaria]